MGGEGVLGAKVVCANGDVAQKPATPFRASDTPNGTNNLHDNGSSTAYVHSFHMNTAPLKRGPSLTFSYPSLP